MVMNDSERFELKKGSQVLLYGAASFGVILFEKLQHYDFEILGFIDQRAYEIKELKGLNVYSSKEAADMFSASDALVIISVKNVFEHSKIARELYGYGLTNIIYKPYAVLGNMGSEEEIKLGQVYDDILSGKFQYGVFLKRFQMEKGGIRFSKKYLIEQEQDYAVMFVSLLLLFENRNTNFKHQERNTMFFFPHIQFFRYMQGNADSSMEYYVEYCETAANELNSFAITDAWKQNVIRNRAQIYVEMEQAYMINRDFFRTGAPEVIWNEKGYFNLVSGKHRAAFFAAEKNPYIPVKMRYDDCEKWLHRNAAEKVKGILEANGIMELKAPIEHPFFYECLCNSRSFFYGLCFTLAEKISQIFYRSPIDNYVDRRRIYMSVDDYGFLGRFFRRCGAVVYEQQNINAEIEKALDNLFYMETSKKEIMEEQKFDIAVIQIDIKDEISSWVEDAKADWYFFVGPKTAMAGMKNIYKGVAWGKQMAVGYLETQNV